MPAMQTPPAMPKPHAIPAPSAPLPVEYDPTVRVTPLTGSLNGDATRLLPLTPPAQPGPPEIPHQPEKPDDAAEPPTASEER
jgi:hypothetical protein